MPPQIAFTSHSHKTSIALLSHLPHLTQALLFFPARHPPQTHLSHTRTAIRFRRLTVLHFQLLPRTMIVSSFIPWLMSTTVTPFIAKGTPIMITSTTLTQFN